ncbi:MAG: PqqD family protein [Bacteroidales bacterium]|nr:PqqD family protein [Bacteroidales bacterium]
MKIDRRKKVREVAGEHIVIMQGEADMTHVVSLNATALWLYGKLLNQTFGAEEVARLLQDEYEVDEATASRDAAAWIVQMRQEGLIVDE